MVVIMRLLIMTSGISRFRFYDYRLHYSGNDHRNSSPITTRLWSSDHCLNQHPIDVVGQDFLHLCSMATPNKRSTAVDTFHFPIGNLQFLVHGIPCQVSSARSSILRYIWRTTAISTSAWTLIRIASLLVFDTTYTTSSTNLPPIFHRSISSTSPHLTFPLFSTLRFCL